MTISVLGHKFQVNSVPFQGDTATRVNIKKRRERIIYRTLSNQDNINIAYLIGQEVTPSNNLFISDRSTSLTQNRIPNSQDIEINTTQTLSLNVNKFLVTDVFTEETATKPETPLFYVHTLENYNDSLANFANMTLLALEFADYSLKSIKITEYILDSSTGKLYNNIENTYNSANQSFDVTFVKYTVRSINGSTQTVAIYHELISNSPVYELADFGDVDVYGNILPGLKKYLIEEIPGGLQFTITLPTSAKYAYKETPESRIKVLSPTAIDISAPWYLRVSNGSFITSLQKTATSFLNHKYYIAEFNSQLYNPFPPYKFQGEQKATWLNKSLIHLSKNIVYNPGIELYVDVIVLDRSDTLKYAYSNNPSKIDEIYTGTSTYSNGILSIDARGGFIELKDEIRDDDIIIVSYYTEEDEYEFTTINFNPIDNLDILNQRIVLYINPEVAGITGVLDRTLYYLIVNSLGEIIYSSQVAENTGGALDTATQKMLDEDFNSDGTPKRTFYYDIDSSASGLHSRVDSGILIDYVEEFSFIDKYSIESVLLTSTTTITGFMVENYEDNPRFLILADIYVGENQAPEALSDFDIRVQGGGIKEGYVEAAVEQNAQAAWYRDFNTHHPYPGAGAYMVQVPQTLLTDHGGDFTRDQIVDIVNRHTKIGGYAIVKTYGIDPNITSVVVDSGIVAIGWPSYGDDTTYNIYYSTIINGLFTQVNTTALVDNISGNEYTVSGLNASTKYYLKVGAIDINNDESYGPIISATTSGIN